MNQLANSPSDILKRASTRLKRDWPGMSARAVAAKLKVSPSYWSKILRGEKPLTESLLPRAVKILRMDAQQIAELQSSMLEAIENERLAPVTGIRTSAKREPSPVKSYGALGQKEFWLLEDWFCIPILNFFTLTNASHTPEEISRRLNLRLDQVVPTIERMEYQGFLKKDEHGKLQRTKLKVRFPTDRSHASVRKYHQSMLNKAKDELARPESAENFDSRLISAVNFAGSPEKLKEAKLILEEAMYRVANLMSDEPASSQIYQLNTQLFSLSR